ncbi:MAG: hypothetical protein ACI9WU_004921 [Myxococcota bacterium]|jgi:hypothetical protein
MRVALTALSFTLLLPFAPGIGASLASSVGFDELAMTLDTTGIAKAAIIRKGNIRRSHSGGYRTNYMVGQDPNHEVTTVEVSISALGDEPSPTPSTDTLTLTPKNKKSASGNRQFENDELTFSNGDGFKHQYSITAKMLDADGKQVGELFTTTAFKPGDIPTTVHSATIGQLDDGAAEVEIVVIGSSLDDLSTIEITIYEGDECPAESDMPLTLNVTQTGVNTLVFSFSGLEFDGCDIAGISYDMELQLIGNDGQFLGSADLSVVASGF